MNLYTYLKLSLMHVQNQLLIEFDFLRIHSEKVASSLKIALHL